ncbi:hypothetical protein KHQ81_14450 [Mycoplasmatota bacterium]|nr:hypothetical protein KHQ81_14450 [Mycoplasmatota bacterium]
MKKESIILLVLSIVIYPIELSFWWVPTKTINEMGLNGLYILTIFGPWFLSIILIILSLSYLKKSNGNKLFKVSLCLSSIFFFLPIAFFIYVISSGITA